MSGGKRTERISERDLEVLEWVARFGSVPRSAVGLWAGTGQTVTWTRERRLRDAGLLELHPAVGDSGPLVLCTRAGLRACGRSDLAAPRFSAPQVFHSAIVAHVAARIERAGGEVLSEREVFARERAEGDRVFSAELGRSRRYHRPDLVLVGNGVEAVEVELTDKAAHRLDELLRGWRSAVIRRKVSRVIYLCSPRALRYVERSLSRIKASGPKLTAAPLRLDGLKSAELPPDLLAEIAAASARQSRAAGPTPSGVDGRAAAATVAGRSGSG